MQRSRAGDSGALGKLLEGYRNYLRLIARVELNPRFRSKISPSDIVQETFHQATRGFGDFRGLREPELIAWLRKILASQLATHVRALTTLRRDIRLEIKLEDSLNRSSVALARSVADSMSAVQSC